MTHVLEKLQEQIDLLGEIGLDLEPYISELKHISERLGEILEEATE